MPLRPSSVSASPSRIGVSIGPGLMALTRILRSFRSVVQLRANERTAAFVAEYTLNEAMPFWETIDAFTMIEPPSGISGSAFGFVQFRLPPAGNVNESPFFGDKEALFRRVMKQYSAGPWSFMSEALNLKTARAVVEALLRMSVKFLVDPGHPRGCLSIQGGLACGSGNEEVKQAMVDSRKAGLAQLQKRLQRARAEGDLKKGVDPRDVARLIIIVMNGLGVQAVNGATPAEMNRAVNLALQSLRLETFCGFALSRFLNGARQAQALQFATHSLQTFTADRDTVRKDRRV
jgi:AcrR family transcriptional regulator